MHALCAQSFILRIHVNLLLVIWYWNSNQFYNIENVNNIFSKLLNLFSTSNQKRKFNMFEAISALINTFSSWYSRSIFYFIFIRATFAFFKKSARFAGTFSSRALLASLSAPRARDLIVALRAPFFLDLALRAQFCALRIHLTLFLII